MPSPLLDNRQLVLSRDGQVIGQASADWNWPFARGIVDLVLRVAPSGEGPAFAGDWYHTTSAFMLAYGLYAEASPHLDSAVAILPYDARILFDRGCIAELFGLPMHQILRGQKTDVGIPSRDATNALLAGDTHGALEVTTRLGERTANRSADPWWSYHLGAGRDFPALLGSLWAQFRL